LDGTLHGAKKRLMIEPPLVDEGRPLEPTLMEPTGKADSTVTGDRSTVARQKRLVDHEAGTERGTRTALELIQSITQLALPVLLSYVGQASLTLVSTAFIGHWTDPESLAAIGLGLALVNITGNALVAGFCSALDTLCANAYGAGDYRTVALVALRGAVIQLVVVAPLIALLWNGLAPHVLAALLTPETAAAASSSLSTAAAAAAGNQTVALATALCRWYTLGLVPMILYEVLKRFLQAQGIVRPIIQVTLVAAVANVLFHTVLIPGLHWGIRGAALSLALSQWALLGTLALVMYKWRLGEQCWHSLLSPSGVYVSVPASGNDAQDGAPRALFRELWREWTPFLALALPGTAWVLVEWGAFEVTLFMAARLPPHPGDRSVADAVATQAVLMNAVYFCFMLPLSIHIGVSVQVGNLVGAGCAAAARLAARLGLMVAAVAGILLAILLTSTRDRWPRLLTNDAYIGERAAQAALFVSLFEIQDCLQYTSVGILKSIGKQRTGALASFLGFWTGCVPLAALFAFVFRQGVNGFWLGFAMGELCLALFYICYIVFVVDWPLEVRDAQNRIQANQ